MSFEIDPVVDQAIIDVEPKILLPDEPFPRLRVLSNLPSYLKKRHLMDRGGHMPPFCESCRPQGMPVLSAH